MNHKQKENATIKELQKYIASLEETVARLSQDPNYGILSGRAALELELEPVKKSIKWVIYGDIDYLHELNEKTPGKHEAVNQMIRRALHFRSSDIALPGTVLPGRWYSGDEIVILIDGDPMAFCERVQESFTREGMSITIAFSKFTGSLSGDTARAKEIVDRMKSERGVGR